MKASLVLLLSVFLITSQSVFSQNDSINYQRPYDMVEESPVYPGGEEALFEYLLSNIQYPVDAKESNIEGTVYVAFVIETDGMVSNVKILRGIGGGCDEEAVRVVKGMPKWAPGKQRGKPVRVLFTLPIKFVLSDDADGPTKASGKAE